MIVMNLGAYDSMKNKDEYIEVLKRLKNWPEETDLITAFGCDDEIEDQEVLIDFYRLFAAEKEISDDMINAFIQLYSLDYNYYYEGVFAFYDNAYGANSKDQIYQAAEWFKKHQFAEIAEVMVQGFDESKHEYVSDWVFDNVKLIYSAYRYIMLLFEKTYLA